MSSVYKFAKQAQDAIPSGLKCEMGDSAVPQSPFSQLSHKWAFCQAVVLNFLFVFLGSHTWHTEVPRLEAELELQLLAYNTATAMGDLNGIWDLHHSSWQHRILNPLSKARDQTCILKDASQIHSCWAMRGTPILMFKEYIWVHLCIQYCNGCIYTRTHKL